MLRASSCSASFFSVAGLICGPLPSRSVEPEPAINSATGGRSTPGGTVSTASMAPTLILLSSAQAFTTDAETERRAANTAATARTRMSLDLPCLFRQHDRDAVADRIGELGRARDQFLLRGVVLERPLGQRTDQYLQQLGIDGVFEAFGRGGHVFGLRLGVRL